jgi:acetoin utilization protein AcuB
MQMQHSAETCRLKIKVHRIMTRKSITLRPEAEIADAVRLFLSQRISCIPIVDNEFRPVGLVSWRDVLKSFAAR